MRTSILTIALATAVAALPAIAQGNAVVVVPQDAGRACHSAQISTAAGPVTVRWGQRAEFGGCRITVSDFDTDRNGRISADEIPPTSSMGRAFSSLDTNQDGFIDDPELQAGNWQ